MLSHPLLHRHSVLLIHTSLITKYFLWEKIVTSIKAEFVDLTSVPPILCRHKQTRTRFLLQPHLLFSRRDCISNHLNFVTKKENKSMYTFRALCTYIKEKELVYNVTLACFLPIRPVAWTNGYALLMIRYLIFYRLSRIMYYLLHTAFATSFFSSKAMCSTCNDRSKKCSVFPQKSRVSKKLQVSQN